MSFRPNRLVFIACAVVTLVLLERHAIARELRFPSSTEDVMALLKQTRPLYWFYGFLGCGFIAVFARYQEWRGWFVVLMAFSSMASLGIALVWVLTYGIEPPNAERGLGAATRDADHAISRFEASHVKVTSAARSNVGQRCANSNECSGGAVCADVGGARRCWLPCGANSSCAEHTICLSAREPGLHVCVRP